MKMSNGGVLGNSGRKRGTNYFPKIIDETKEEEDET